MLFARSMDRQHQHHYLMGWHGSALSWKRTELRWMCSSSTAFAKRRLKIDVFCGYPLSEIEPQIRHERTIPRRSCDAAKRRIVDIQIRIPEIRMVENIERVQPQLELLRFGNPDLLNKVHIQTEIGRTFNPIQTHIPVPSGGCVHQQKSVL